MSFINEREEYSNLKHRELYTLDAKLINADSTLVVVIIGESCNRNHMSVYGYNRPTTPRLQARKDIMVFDNVISANSSTLKSIILPHIFKFRFGEVFIVGNGLCAVPENVRQTARNDTQVVPYKVFAFYTNTSINWNLILNSQFSMKKGSQKRAFFLFFIFFLAVYTKYGQA